MSFPPSRRDAGATGLAAAGLLIGIGGVLHPRVDTKLEFERGLAAMFESSTWVASHLLTMAGFAVLAASITVLLRGRGRAWPSRLRTLGWLAGAAAGLAAIEALPHLIAASEATAVRQGGSTPLTELHTTLQAASTPAVGLSVAALALAGARSRDLDGGRIAASLAVLGGVVFALAGPAIAVTENSALSPLFAGSAGLAIWMVVCGIRAGRSTAGAPVSDRRADQEGDLGLAAGRAR